MSVMMSSPGVCRHQWLYVGKIKRVDYSEKDQDALSKSPESETTVVPVCLSWSREVVMFNEGLVMTD